jgi:hypothetical protein
MTKPRHQNRRRRSPPKGLTQPSVSPSPANSPATSNGPAATKGNTTGNRPNVRPKRLRRIGRWWNKYYAAIVALVALIGGVPGAVNYLKNHFTDPSLQQIVDQAEGWSTTYTANFGSAFKLSNWSVYYQDTPPHALSTSDDTLYLNVRTSKQGGYAFFQDEEPGATLRAGNFYLSADVSQPSGCEYGLVFNIDYDNRFGWEYIDDTGGETDYGLDVSAGQSGDLSDVLPEKAFNEAVDTIGIVRYGSEYIIVINGMAQGDVTAQSLDRLADGALAGPGIGIGTFTCPHKNSEYIYSNVTVQVPYDNVKISL